METMLRNLQKENCYCLELLVISEQYMQCMKILFKQIKRQFLIYISTLYFNSSNRYMALWEANSNHARKDCLGWFAFYSSSGIIIFVASDQGVGPSFIQTC